MKNEAKSNNTNNKDDLDDEDDSKIFPQRLMSILSDERNQEAICWLPHGRSFIVRNRKLFAETVMCRNFSRKAKYSSFTRKLNRWNFIRVSSGPELGAYHHEFFLRDKPHLAAQMFCKNARTMLAMAAPHSSSAAPTQPSALGAVLNDSSEKSTPVSDEETTPAVLAPVAAPQPPKAVAAPTTITPPPQSNSSSSSSSLASAFAHFSNQSTEQVNAAMALKKEQFMTMLGGHTPANVLQMLDRQIQFIQQQHQQEQARRLLMAMHVSGGKNSPKLSPSPVAVNNSNNNNGMRQQLTPQAVQEMQLLRLRQMMELNRRQQQQQQHRQPTNNRASAA